MSLSVEHGLVASTGSERTPDGWMATTSEPWLLLDSSVCRQSWLRLSYSCSLMDEPVRPLIRFTTRAGDVFTEPMNGAILGSAEWLGRIPPDTMEIAISSSRRSGPFNFRIDSISGASTAKLMVQGILQSWLWSYWTVRSLVVGSNREAWQALRSATDGTRFNDYASWHRRHARAPDFCGFDAPRFNPDTGIRFAVLIEGGDELAVQRTLQSLEGQSYRRFVVRRDASWATFRDSLAPADWVVAMQPGDRLQPYAFALLAEKLAEPNQLDAIYTDEDSVAPDGMLHSPSLKPDWSPIYQAQAHFVKRALFIRAGAMTDDAGPAGATLTGRLLHVLEALPPGKIHHLRRILYRSERPVPVEPAVTTAAAPKPSDVSPWPSVSVIIPTRDRKTLLATCIESIRAHTDYPCFDIVIVDNGSTAPDAVAYLNELQRDSAIKLVRGPGPFNYSSLCNSGAAASDAQIVVFLNNDTEIREGSDWLKSLVRWAALPDVGAVGARLLFGNGRVQHAGVVLGMSGIAGHPYLHQPDIAAKGQWSGATHEISAVTGACLAVDRNKFNDVAGFDEQLAVDLNDIDLCLRLSERGWSNVWTPDARLIHHESASRGIAKNYFEAYRREIALFNARWAHIIRDDPYFHPGLSLYAYDIRLA